MKPNFTLCLLLLLLFSSSCSKDIKKRDITGRWDLFRSESRYHYVYPTTNEEVISYYLFENNIEVNTEYEDYQF